MLSDNFESTLDGSMSGSTSFTTEAALHLRTAGKWGRFLAILGFVFLGIAVLGLLVGGSALFALGTGMGEMGLMGGLGVIMMLFYLAIFAFSFYLYYLLYQFSTNAIAAADTQSGAALTASMASLSKLFTIAGVFTLGIMVLYIVGIVGALIFGAISGL